MERIPSAHVRISEMLVREPRDVRTPDAWWETRSAQTDPALPLGFLLAGRESASAVQRAGLVPIEQPDDVLLVAEAGPDGAVTDQTPLRGLVGFGARPPQPRDLYAVDSARIGLGGRRPRRCSFTR